MEKRQLQYLIKKNKQIKLNILETCYYFGGHIATSYSCTELLVYLYYNNYLKIDPKKPKNPNRDYLIISKGHCSEAIYSILGDLNFFKKKILNETKLRNKNMIGEHVEKVVPGVEFSSGALGHGLPFACGKAMVLKKDKKKNKVYVLIGDAELCEGSMWESLLFAKQNHLNNLYILLDYNKIGAVEFIEKMFPQDLILSQFKSLNFDYFFVNNGNNFNSINTVLTRVNKKKSNNPKVIIFNTVKGSGYKEFENQPIWHVKKITKKIFEKAKKHFTE